MIARISAADYHADRVADVPTLSASIASVLCNQSPLHAWWRHPKLNPAWAHPTPKDEQRYAVGTATHALLLEGEKAVDIADFPDWRTKEAREIRDAARAVGRLPLLAKDWDAVVEMSEEVRLKLVDVNAAPPLFRDGQAEATLIWEEAGGVICRARPDWLRDDGAAIDDLKTTAKSAHPEAYSRAIYGVGGDIQASFYIRGARHLTGTTPTFRWVVVENTPPYELMVIEPGPDVLALGEAKVERALELWRGCLASGQWPGYPRQVATATLPAYEEARWLEREYEAAA